jgi:hypothetical protein
MKKKEIAQAYVCEIILDMQSLRDAIALQSGTSAETGS